MNDTKLDEIITILRSIILQNQSQNIYESKMVNGLKFENNIISFTLELLPEQLKQSESIKKFIQEKLYVVDNVKKVEIILTSSTTYNFSLINFLIDSDCFKCSGRSSRVNEIILFSNFKPFTILFS